MQKKVFTKNTAKGKRIIMNENIKKLMKTVSENPEIAAKFSGVTDPEEAFKLASSIQDGFTKEEFMAAVEAVEAYMEGSKELSDEDLSKVAGGDFSDVMETIWLSVKVVATATPALAAAI